MADTGSSDCGCWVMVDVVVQAAGNRSGMVDMFIVMGDGRDSMLVEPERKGPG